MELAVNWLELAGYQVLQVPTAEEVILLAHQNRPDLILMDTRLPGMDGLEATRQLKRDPVLSLSPLSWCPPWWGVVIMRLPARRVRRIHR
jgi:CheY-like chemotaxis protein